jgi:hypothetical protein
LHCERCGIVGCVVRKWVEDKWNEKVLIQVNNKALIVGFTPERKHVGTTFKGTSTRTK